MNSFLLRSYFDGWVGRVGAAGPGVLPLGTPPPNLTPDLPGVTGLAGLASAIPEPAKATTSPLASRANECVSYRNLHLKFILQSPPPFAAVVRR